MVKFSRKNFSGTENFLASKYINMAFHLHRGKVRIKDRKNVWMHNFLLQTLIEVCRNGLFISDTRSPLTFQFEGIGGRQKYWKNVSSSKQNFLAEIISLCFVWSKKIERKLIYEKKHEFFSFINRHTVNIWQRNVLERCKILSHKKGGCLHFVSIYNI